MKSMMQKIKSSYNHQLPIIKLYAVLYLIGIFIGATAAVLLRDSFSLQAQLLFSPENCCGFFSAFLQQFIFFIFLFFLGLTVIGIPLIPLYPIYKGFSIGLLIALAIILTGVRGLFFGTLAFFAPNALYTLLGYFLCYSSARLSVALFEQLKGRGKHGASYREFIHHVYCLIAVLPFLTLGAAWESKVVPLLLSLF